MAGEESAAAVDTSGGDSGGDAGVAAEGVSTDPANDNAAEGGEAAKPGEPKYKFRRYGKDAEHTAEEMRAMLDDEYEHSFHGVGGKPLLLDGKPLTARNRDILRYVQQGKGAADSARRYNEAAKQFQAQIEWGKDPANTIAFMRDVMGMEDPRKWALEYAATQFDQTSKLAKLAQTDPVAHARAVEEQIRADHSALEKARQARGQRETQERDRQQREQQFYGTVTQSLSKHGVPFNARTRELVDQTCKEWSDAGAELSFEQLAEIVRDAYHEEIFGYLDPKDDESLLKLFGDKRRERLRKAEIAALKGAKKDAAPPKPKEPPASSNGNGRRDDGRQTARDFLRSGRNGGRL